MVLDAVAYLRVSTDMQDINAQRVAVLEYAKKNNFNIVKEFKDEDVSGATRIYDRKAVKEMLEFCKSNDIHHIIAYDLTRLGRYDPFDLVTDIRNISKEYDVVFHFVNEPQINDPMLKKIWDFVKTWFAEFERLQISRRTRYGLEKLKQEGRLYHRPSLIHYYACVLFNKDLSKITNDDVERAKQVLKQYINSYLVNGVKKLKIPELLMKNELKPVYLRFPKAPKNPFSMYKLLKREGLL
jgi:DNA invertase Pin-like site-specific DNA recombinase